MRVSIIIPCYKAEDCLARAMNSIAAQSVLAQKNGVDVDVIIAADDHVNYDFAQQIFPKTLIIPRVSGRVGSGPGATRNRGIMASGGDVLAFLDADDAWQDNYLEEMIPLVKKKGAAFAPTAVFSHEKTELITLGKSLKTLTLLEFGRWPGSFHPCLFRTLSPGFTDGAGQDVFHAMEVLGRVGGRAPMAQHTQYRLHLQAGSVTANPQFSAKIDKRYHEFIHACDDVHSSLQGMAKIQAKQALYQRIGWNKAWLKEGCHEHGFYGFVGQRIPKK